MINFDRNSVAAPHIGAGYQTSQAVYNALEELFHNKCYLCETWRDSATNFQIEHFHPHKGDASLKYNWDNLFLACGDTCNQYKSTQIDILNPCDPNHNVEEDICYVLTPIDYEPKFSATDSSNILAANTSELLEHLHHGKRDWKSKSKTRSLRNAIRRRTTELLTATKSYYQADNRGDESAKQLALNRIADIVSRKAPFTMLMRSEAKKDGFEFLFD
ncbi:MAG: hypothetical protein ACPG8W_04870 [Candidatus Promineifilaceae bacterium]